MDLEPVPGEFANETPISLELALFLPTSFKADYREMWAISARFFGNSATILRTGD
jgi:hypothetical protein